MEQLNICEYCKLKKLSTVYFNCKCGYTKLCTKCRDAESHGCKYDYRKNGKNIIIKNNPIIINSKIDKL